MKKSYPFEIIWSISIELSPSVPWSFLGVLLINSFLSSAFRHLVVVLKLLVKSLKMPLVLKIFFSMFNFHNFFLCPCEDALKCKHLHNLVIRKIFFKSCVAPHLISLLIGISWRLIVYEWLINYLSVFPIVLSRRWTSNAWRIEWKLLEKNCMKKKSF